MAEKNRHWAFVAYPESLPEDWKDQLQATGLPFAVSPLHDKDVDPTGTKKKAHYHVIMSFPGPARLSQAKEITDMLGQPQPKALKSILGYYRYFTHMDNPEKAQYSSDDIEVYNGFEVPDLSRKLTSDEVVKCKKKIQTLCIEMDIVEYSVLMDVLALDDNEDLYAVASSNTIFCTAYLTSRRNMKKRNY